MAQRRDLREALLPILRGARDGDLPNLQPFPDAIPLYPAAVRFAARHSLLEPDDGNLRLTEAGETVLRLLENPAAP
ncbi:MAG TPA: hypothetical protein VHN99_00435 [Deinococcales bacterium]|nr:hypothetical protein [Deinococcales bacterium]